MISPPTRSPPPLAPLGYSCRVSEIPHCYTLDKLHELAPVFWQDGDSSNCTILVRDSSDVISGVATERTTCTPPPTPPISVGSLPSCPDDEEWDRARSRVEPLRHGQIPVLGYKLHADYLAPQSLLLRRFLTSPLTPPPSSLDAGSSADLVSPGRAQIIPSLTTTDHTTVLLTLPDPHSFPLILHYLYWGRTDIVYKALCDGQVCWKGLVNNVEFLGLDKTLKIICGRYWKHHVAGRDEVSALYSSPSKSLVSP